MPGYSNFCSADTSAGFSLEGDLGIETVLISFLVNLEGWPLLHATANSASVSTRTLDVAVDFISQTARAATPIGHSVCVNEVLGSAKGTKYHNRAVIRV